MFAAASTHLDTRQCKRKQTSSEKNTTEQKPEETVIPSSFQTNASPAWKHISCLSFVNPTVSFTWRSFPSYLRALPRAPDTWRSYSTCLTGFRGKWDMAPVSSSDEELTLDLISLWLANNKCIRKELKWAFNRKCCNFKWLELRVSAGADPGCLRDRG